jgi:hypothetical protein
MKKILFASLILLMLGGITYAQTSPFKTNTSQKKEAVKKDVKATGSVSSVAPVYTARNTTTGSKTKTVTKTSSKPKAPAASTQTVPSSTIGKHKKRHHTAKKHK